MRFSLILQQIFSVVPSTHKGYRPDIDGMRAIAVLAVVVYHYAPQLLPGGFIGVDIFFVISGYLITGILAKSFEANTFSLRDFYQRRVHRIFPALSTVLAFCLATGWLVMLASEYKILGKHIAAGAGFVQNIVLMGEAGYFDSSAIQKPLLHLWSLAVEEQFYIFWPLIVWFIMYKRWPIMSSIILIAIISFILNVIGIYKGHNVSVFYLPFTRAWELMAGAWLAMGHRQQLGWLNIKASTQSWVGLTLLCIGFIIIHPEKFPGFWGLIPVIGSMLIINGGVSAFPNRTLLSLRPAVWIGLISYPLYLWHWTLLSFLVIAFGDRIDTLSLCKYKILAIILSVILSYLTYQFLERPIRKHRYSKTTKKLIISVLCIGLSGLIIYALNGIKSRPLSYVSDVAQTYADSIERSSLSSSCFDLNRESELADNWSCTLGDNESDTWIAAYGDSHALSLIPALDRYGKKAGVRILFAGLSGCPPLLGIYPDRDSGPACVQLVNNMTQIIKKDQASLAILIGRWTYYSGGTTKPEDIQAIKLLDTSKHQNNNTVKGLEALQTGLETTVIYYDSLNIPVLFLDDNPQQSTDLPKGIARFSQEKNDDYINKTSVLASEHYRNQREVREILKSVTAYFPQASILNTDSVLCGTYRCPWVNDGKFLYFDDDHLSIYGAMIVYPLLEKQLNQILNIN